MVADRAAVGVRYRKRDLFFEDVAPGLLGRVGEVEPDAELADAPDERSAEIRQALGRRVDSSRELVCVVPGQAHGPHAASVPLLDRVRIAFERLDTLQRENEPQPRVVELSARIDAADAVGVLLEGAPELRLLGERARACVAAA